MKKTVAFLVVLVCAGSTAVYFLVLKGCRYFPESTFKLASSSRLPRWIVLPVGTNRSEVELLMSYYSTPWGPNVGFKLQNNSGRVIEQVYGNECLPRFSFEPPAHQYPNYIPIAVNGITELIEHKKMEPVFYVTNEPPPSERDKTKGCK